MVNPLTVIKEKIIFRDMPSIKEMSDITERTGGTVEFGAGGGAIITSPGGKFVPGSDSGFQVQPGTTPQYTRPQAGTGQSSRFQELVRQQRIREAQERAIANQQRQAEILRQAEITRQANIQKQQLAEKNIAIGSAAQTSRWKFQNGKSVETPVTSLTKNIGESQAAFRERQRSLGAGIRGGQPGDVKRFEQKIITGKTETFPDVTLEPRPLSFTIPPGQEGGGTQFIVGFTPDLTRLDVTRQGTTFDMPKFDSRFIISPTYSPDLKIITTKTEPQFKFDIQKDVTRQATISPDIPKLESPLAFIQSPPTFTEKLREKSFTEETKGQPTFLGVGGGILAGGIVSIKGGIQGTKQLVTQPLETIGRGLEAVTIKLPETAARVGTVIQQEPAFATGFVLGEFAQFKAIGVGQKFAVRGFDRIRTMGLRELPVVKSGDVSFARRGRNVFFERDPFGKFKQQKFEIIAPEFPKQTFPLIKKGQTAGQLKAEFQRLLPGEKLPAGFTASPNPLGELITSPGSSEILGTYQAGRTSPRFLRIADDKGLVSVGILGDTLRPTVFRITPSRGFKLAPGIKTSTKVIQPQKLSKIKSFIETKAPKGQSTIPFIKAEKEAIITQAGVLSKPKTRFFFKFEGRRIPIQETTALAEGVSVPGQISSADIISSLSSSRVGRTGVFTPVDITSQLRRGGTSVSSSTISPTKITLIPSSSKISSRKRSSISSVISSIKSSRSIIRPSKVRSISSRITPRISSIASSSARSLRGARSIIKPSGVSRARPMISKITPTPKTFFKPFVGKGIKLPKIPSQKFQVFGKRFGKFKIIGTGRTQKQAFSLGKKWARKTLGVTFKVKGAKARKLTGFQTQTKKGDILYIEPIGKRLKKRGTEVKEIQLYQKAKGGKKSLWN